LLDYYDNARLGGGRHDIEGVSHVVVGRDYRNLYRPTEPVGSVFLHHNPNVLPRARLVGRPVYVDNPAGAVAALIRLGPESRSRLIVEDPTRPLSETEEAEGSARIVRDLPEDVVVATDSPGSSYLFLADTFDPGWSVTVDGHPESIRPAYAAFRAVALGPGGHTVRFTYRPAGFTLGLAVTAIGVALAFLLWLAAPVAHSGGAGPATLDAAGSLRKGLFATIVLIVLLSLVRVEPGSKL